MSFADLPSSSPEISKRQEEVALAAARFGIEASVMSSIRGVFQWQQLLLSPSGTDEAKTLLNYFKAMGYLPDQTRSISGAMVGSAEVIEEATSKIVDDLMSGRLTPAGLISEDAVAVKVHYPQLTKPQIHFLQSIVSQEMHLNALDVDSLVVQAPFPVTQYNYFGRFLAGGCETPQQAARHLQLATPFLIRMRSLFEGLGNKEHNFLHLDIHSSAERTANDPKSGIKRAGGAVHLEAVQMIHAAINHSPDFWGRVSAEKGQRLVCIQMPGLPNVNAAHIDKKRYSELAVALYEWLLTGKRDSELLRSSSLASTKDILLSGYERKLREAQRQLKSLDDAPANQDSTRSERKRVAREANRWQTRITNYESKIESLKEERSLITPIIRQLEEGGGGLREFRNEVKKARDAGARIVFSFFKEHPGKPIGSIVQWLDLAINAPRLLSNSEAVKILRDSSFLVNDSAAGHLRSGFIARANNVKDHHLRAFPIDTTEINLSVKFVIAGILPRREDPQISALLSRIVEHLPPPGVNSARELTFLVQRASGKQNPSAGDYLEYTFERLPRMSQDQLYTVLDSLHQLGISRIPSRVQEVSKERFKHPSAALSSFSVYSSRYRPNKLGRAPEIFMDRASFATYLNLGIDSFGMATEVQAIQKHLKERGIVAVVDGTNYHPELDATIDATGDKLEKGDAEKTSEVWGDYVRPSERVVRAFALRLMEGDVDSGLKNASFMGIVTPDKVSQVMQKLIKKFYGLDIDINPDLSAINQLLADLKLHDDNVVLVVDARSINDLEQYREFVGLLEKYQIKIILRTREPFPGVPQVNIQPFLEDSVVERIMMDSERLKKKLELSQPIERSIVEFAARQVQRCRQPQADPLNLTLVVLDGAAAHARLHPDRAITEQDVVAALPPIFHLPDGQQMRLRIDAIESFVKRAPLQVLGQDRAIESIARKVKSHILGMRDPTRPLTLLIPGPTGVGKTELMMCIARVCDIPFFMIEGAEFSEEHTVSRLVGSPSGYVGPDEGILFTFLKENNMGLVFIDEIEKMHPAVYQALMNFFDKATLTAGNGKSVSRPGFIIVGASNAGAARLTRAMDTRQVKEILSESFVDRLGRPRPELVRRFDPIVMHAIERTAFKQLLHASIEAIGGRPGFVNANLRLVGFDSAALDLLYDKSREVCEYNETSNKRLGFHGVSSGPAEDGMFYDMRHVGRALDDLAGEALQELALEQYAKGNEGLRGQPKRVRFVGDTENERIVLVAE